MTKFISFFAALFISVISFETPKGDIQLSMQKGEYGQYFVLLKYYDKINTDTVRSAAIDDL